MAALDLDYAEYLRLNGGRETCAICGAAPGTRRLQRDHCHALGVARGLLCVRCNRALAQWITPEWLRAAANYLERASGDRPTWARH